MSEGMKENQDFENNQIEVIYVQDFVDACFRAEKEIEHDPNVTNIFLIDLDGTLTTGLLSYVMKFPFITYAIDFLANNTEYELITDLNIEALKSLYERLNGRCIAIVTNRQPEEKIWKSQTLVANSERRLRDFNMPIFFNTNRLVPDGVLQLTKRKNRTIEIINWIKSVTGPSEQITVTIISDKSIPEAPTEKIFMRALLKRLHNANGRIIQID